MSKTTRVRSWGSLLVGSSGLVACVVMLVEGPREESNWGEGGALILMLAAIACRFLCDSFRRTRRWGRRAAIVFVCLGLTWLMVAYAYYDIGVLTLSCAICTGTMASMVNLDTSKSKAPASNGCLSEKKGYRKRLGRRYPELSYFETDEEHDKAWKHATSDAARSLLVWALTISSFLALNMLEVLAGLVLAVLVGPPRSILPSLAWLFSQDRIGQILIALLCFAEFLLFTWLWFWMARGTMRRSLQQQLMQMGIPLCTNCSYDLRENISGRCPECGMVFKTAST